MATKHLLMNGYAVSVEAERLPGRGGPSSRIQFSFISETKLTEEDATFLQTEMNYHPAGYGHWGFKQSKVGDRYIGSWTCSGSCD